MTVTLTASTPNTPQSSSRGSTGPGTSYGPAAAIAALADDSCDALNTTRPATPASQIESTTEGEANG